MSWNDDPTGDFRAQHIAATFRDELDRRRLHAFVEELVAELGPSDESEVARYGELFTVSADLGEGRDRD